MRAAKVAGWEHPALQSNEGTPGRSREWEKESLPSERSANIVLRDKKQRRTDCFTVGGGAGYLDAELMRSGLQIGGCIEHSPCMAQQYDANTNGAEVGFACCAMRSGNAAGAQQQQQAPNKNKTETARFSWGLVGLCCFLPLSTSGVPAAVLTSGRTGHRGWEWGDEQMAPAHACDICGVAHNAKGRPFASLEAVDAHMRDAHGLRTLDEQEGIESTQYLSDLLNILDETKFPAEMWKNIMPHLQQLERLLTHGGGSGIIDALEVLVKPQVKTTRPSKADPPLAMPDYFSGRHTKPSIVGDYAVGGHNHTCAQRLLNDSVSSSCQCLRYLQAHPDAHSPKLGKRSASFLTPELF